MHIDPRSTSLIEKVVVHVNVGDEVENGAQGLVNYLKTIDAGYHVVTDDFHIVVAAGDDQRVWGASGANLHGLHVCIIGRADQTAAQWMDPYSDKAMQNAAQVTADWCKRYSIPVLRLSPSQVATSAKGICGHVDVERSGLPGTGGMSGHYDPGPNFPWGTFLTRVQVQIVGDQPPAQPVEEDMKVMFEANGVPDGNPFCGCEIDVQAQTVELLGGAGFVPAPGAFIGKWKNVFKSDKDFPGGVAHIVIVNDKLEKFDFKLKSR